MKTWAGILFFCLQSVAFAEYKTVADIPRCTGSPVDRSGMLNMVPSGQTTSTPIHLNLYVFSRQCHEIAGCSDWTRSNEILNVVRYGYADGGYSGMFNYLPENEWISNVVIEGKQVKLAVSHENYSIVFAGNNSYGGNDFYLYHYSGPGTLLFSTNRTDQSFDHERKPYFANLAIGYFVGSIYENNCVYFSSKINKEIPDSSGRYSERVAVFTTN